MFSGLTKCGECGAGFIVYSREQLGCFGTRDRGRCTNKLTISRHEVEERVLSALQDKLMRKDWRSRMTKGDAVQPASIRGFVHLASLLRSRSCCRFCVDAAVLMQEV